MITYVTIEESKFADLYNMIADQREIIKRMYEIVGDNRPIDVKEAAKLLGVDPSTVKRWLLDKKIKGYQSTPGGKYTLELQDVLEFKNSIRT